MGHEHYRDVAKSIIFGNQPLGADVARSGNNANIAFRVSQMRLEVLASESLRDQRYERRLDTDKMQAR